MKLPFNVVNSSKLAKVMMAASIAVPAVVAPMPFVNEDVEAAEVIEIWSVQDLDNIRNNLSGHYKLMADLDLSGIEWEPIGTSSANFTGIFDGNGHVIKNLTINKPNTDYVGLFGYVYGGEIKDVVLENVNVVGKRYTGALAGYIDNNAKVTNVGVEGGKVTGNDRVGGLVGKQGSGTINQAYVTSTVEGTEEVGGLVGELYGTAKQVYATGEVTGNSDVGGLVGHQIYGTISHAYATGKVTGNSSVGGLVGGQNNGTINNAFALNPRVTGTSNVGKAIGNGSRFSEVYAHEQIQGYSKTTGITGIINESERNNFSTYGFDPSVWEFNSAIGLPVLKGLPNNIQAPVYDSKVTLMEDEEGVFIPIRNVAELDQVRYSLRETRYKLMADLDLSGIEWEPIGTSSANFTGIFDGNGHVIKNLIINKPNTDYVGLFGYVYGGEIKDVVLENVNVVGKRYTGALAGYIDNNAKVTNVGVEGGKVTGNDRVGGLVGKQGSGTINQAYVTSTVEGTEEVGGLVGELYGTAKQVYATGEVTGNSDVGGLVGHQIYGTISHAYATGKVTGNSSVGGLVGGQNNGTINNAFALNPRVTGTSNVGKAIGAGSKFSDVYLYSGMVGMPGMTRDDDYTGVYSDQELLQRSTYENHGFDFSIWLIDEGRSLPYFPFSVNKTGLDGLPIYDNESPIVTHPIADSTLIASGNARVLDVSGYFEDPDGDILTYIVTSSDDSVASVEQQGSIIMIRPHQEGEVTITVTAKDGKGGEVSTTFTVTVQQNNQVPIVSSPITNQLLVMGDDPLTIDLSQHFHDGDEDELAFAVTSSNPNAVNATVEGSILTLEAENIGYSTITVTASDGKGGEVSTTFTVDVEGLVMPTLTVKDISSNSIEIEWSPVQGAVSYTIYRKEKTQGLMAKVFSFMSLATGGTGLEDGYEEVYHGSATSFVDTNVKKATVYEYIAVAHSANGATSEYSEKIEAATYQSITINWLPVQNEEGEYAAKYRVERYQYEPNGSLIDSKVLGEVNHPTTKYTDYKAHPGKTNRYKVVPIYADGTEGPPIEFPDIEVPTDPDEDVDIEPPVVEDPEQPGNPNEPENPENPEEPENPVDPEEPTDPENPDEPEEPTDPENPDDPEEPTDPENPDDPEEPSDPENPDEPEEPTDPENPDNPNNPNEPTVPEEPGNPDEPENPEEPTNPNPPDDGDDDENKDDGKKDVVTGPDFITISWFRIPGAAYYEVMKNGQVVYSVEDDPTKDYYSYTDKPIDPTKAYHYEVMPYADDGTPIGDGPIEFVNVPAPTFTVLEKKLGETIVQINFSDELETNNYYSLDGETFQEYTGPISVTKNRTVIYAYARYAPTGDRSPMVTYVVDVEKITEIAPPTFTVISETDEETLLQIHYQTEVETKNYYSYDNKLWHEYTGPITITKNGTRIYARSVEEQTGVKSPTSSIVVYVGVGTNPVGEQPGEIVEDGEEAPSDVLPAPVVKRVLYDVDDTITFFVDAKNANLVEVNGKVGMSKNGEFVVTLQTDADGEEYYHIESFDTKGNDSEDVVLTYNLTDFVQMRERDKNVKMQTEGNGTRFTFDEVPNVDRYNLTIELGDLKITSPFTDETQGPINTIRHIPKLPYSEGYQVSVNMVQGLVMVMGKPEIVDYKMVLTNVKFIDNPNFKNSKGVQFEGTYGEVTVDLMKDGELYQRKSGKNTVWFLNLENGEYEVVIDGQSYGTFTIGQPASEIPDLDPTELTVTIIDGAKKNSKGVKVEGTNEVIEVELRKDGEIIGTAKTSKGTAYFHNLTNGTYDVYISGVKVAEFTMGDTQSPAPETPDLDPTELTVTIIDGAKKNSKGVKVEGTNEVIEVELRKDDEIIGTAKTSKGTAYFHNLTNGTYDVYILGEKVADFTMEDGTPKEDEVNLDDLSILLEDVTLENGIRKGSKAVVVMGTDQVVEVELRKDGETISKAKTTKGKAYFHNLIEGERYEVYIGGKSFGHFIMKHDQPEEAPSVDPSSLTIKIEDNNKRANSKAITVEGTKDSVEVELRQNGETIQTTRTTQGIAYFFNLVEGEEYEVFIGGQSFGTFIMKKETSEAPAAEYTGILLDHTRSTSKGVEVNDAPNGIEVKVVSETTTKTAKISYGKAWFHLLPSGTYTVYIGDSIVKDEEGNDLVFTIE